MFKAVTAYEHSALKACFIVNGGALIAIVAFLGNILSKDKPVPTLTLGWLYASVALWCIGLLLAVAAHAAGYWSQVCFFRSTGNVDPGEAETQERKGYDAAKLTYGLFVVSVVAFGAGAVSVLVSLP